MLQTQNWVCQNLISPTMAPPPCRRFFLPGEEARVHQYTRQLTPATGYLLVGPSLPERFGAKCRTKGDNLAHRGGSWAWGSHPYLVNTQTSGKTRKTEAMAGKRAECAPQAEKDAEQENLISVSNAASQVYPRLLGTNPHETLIDTRLVETFPLCMENMSISVPERTNPGPYRK